MEDSHELSLFVTETTRTGLVIHEALDQAGWPGNQRDIDAGQIRLQPAHYTSILSPRALGKVGPVLRATEDAEPGLLTERRGDFVVFEERFHRELNILPSLYTFGTSSGSIPVEREVTPQESWDNVYTVISVGADRAVVQTEKKVYTFRKDDIIQHPFRVPAGRTYTIVLDMVDERFESYLEDENVKSVIDWTPLDPSHYILANGTLTFPSRSRTSTTARIVASPNVDAVLTKLELWGRGVALYGDLTIPEISDPAAVALYQRRVLALPTSIIGDGLNEGGDGIAEGTAYAEMLLLRYAKPIISGRLQFDPFDSPEASSAMVQLQTSDPVMVEAVTGMPAGIYYVEGGDFQFDAHRGWSEMGINISQRGRRVYVADVPVNVTPPDTVWVDVAPAVMLGADQSYVVASYVTFPTGTAPSTSDDPVMRVMRGNEQYSVWSETDIPINDPQFRASLVAGPGMVKIQVRRRILTGPQITASRWRVIRIDS